MAKRVKAPYRPGRRSDDWRKIKLTDTQDCVILGWTPGQGGRGTSFGALLVGATNEITAVSLSSMVTTWEAPAAILA